MASAFELEPGATYKLAVTCDTEFNMGLFFSATATGGQKMLLDSGWSTNKTYSDGGVVFNPTGASMSYTVTITAPSSETVYLLANFKSNPEVALNDNSDVAKAIKKAIENIKIIKVSN